MTLYKKKIGGYNSLELKDGKEYHSKLYDFNSARNALIYILIKKKVKKISIPYYICSSIIKALKNNNIEYSFYRINESLLPIDKYFSNTLLYVNYFGVCDKNISKVKKYSRHTIIDNSQSFFSQPRFSLDTIYSPRKFFGIPDGGYLFTETKINNNQLKFNNVENMFSHFFKYYSESNEGYLAFKNNEYKFDKLKPLRMSLVSKALLKSIDYKQASIDRVKNFSLYSKKLDKYNQLDFNISMKSVPMVYPLLIGNGNKLRKKLINNNIFTAKYWNNVLKHRDKIKFEKYLSQNILALPVSHKLSYDDIQYVITFIKNELIN